MLPAKVTDTAETLAREIPRGLHIQFLQDFIEFSDISIESTLEMLDGYKPEEQEVIKKEKFDSLPEAEKLEIAVSILDSYTDTGYSHVACPFLGGKLAGIFPVILQSVAMFKAPNKARTKSITATYSAEDGEINFKYGL
jgi:hypothetical protein